MRLVSMLPPNVGASANYVGASANIQACKTLGNLHYRIPLLSLIYGALRTALRYFRLNGRLRLTMADGNCQTECGVAFPQLVADKSFSVSARPAPSAGRFRSASKNLTGFVIPERTGRGVFGPRWGQGKNVRRFAARISAAVRRCDGSLRG